MAGCRARRYGASWAERATRGRDEVSSGGGGRDSCGVEVEAEGGNGKGKGGGQDKIGRRIDCTVGRRGLRWRARIVSCMNLRVTRASGPASPMHRGSWSRDDDGSDVHDTADWICELAAREWFETEPPVWPGFWRGPYPRISVQLGACDWRIGIVGGRAVVAFGRRLADVITVEVTAIGRLFVLVVVLTNGRCSRGKVMMLADGRLKSIQDHPIHA